MERRMGRSMRQLWRARGTVMSRFDVYAHNPSDMRRLGTWPGFAFTMLMILLVIASTTFIVYSYITTPFDLSETVVDIDKDFALTPESNPPFPKVFVAFINEKGKFFTDGKIFKIGFDQILTLPNDEVEVAIPTTDCVLPLGDDLLPVSCPLFGDLNETILNSKEPESAFVPTDGRKGATVPRIQGDELDPRFAFLQATVVVDLGNLKKKNKTLENIYNGAIFYGILSNSYNLKGTTLRDSMADRLREKFKFWLIPVRQLLATSAVLDLGIRTIQKGNFLMDFELFEDEFFDIEVREQDQTAVEIGIIRNSEFNLTGLLPEKSDNTEVPDSLPLALISIKFSQGFLNVHMTPFSTLGEILGALGGISSLLVFVIGVPAVYINRLLFRHMLQNAQNTGLLDETMFHRDGTLKFDRMNEAMERLTQAGYFRTRRKAKRLRGTNNTNRSEL